MKTNPFELTFGLKPDNYISRLKQSEEIISSIEEGTNLKNYIEKMLSDIADTYEDSKLYAKKIDETLKRIDK